MKKGIAEVDEGGIYLKDENGTEITSWTIDEWTSDPEVVPCIVNATVMLLEKGPDVLKESINWKNDVGYDPNDFNGLEYRTVIMPALKKHFQNMMDKENNTAAMHKANMSLSLGELEIIEIVFGGIGPHGEIEYLPKTFEDYKIGFGVDVQTHLYDGMEGNIKIEGEVYYVTLIVDRDEDGLTIKECRDMLDEDFK